MDFKEYWQEIQRGRLLERSEESKLWRRYKEEADLEARRVLIESYQPLVFKVLTTWKSMPEDFLQELAQEGAVGLIESVERYDHKRGVAFSLYALHRIRGRILTFAQKENRHDLTYIDKPMYNEESVATLGEFLPDTALSVAEQAEAHFLAGQLHLAMRRLPEKEQLVLDGVYVRNREAKDLARDMELSTSHIYRLQKQGIRRIRGMLSRLMQHW